MNKRNALILTLFMLVLYTAGCNSEKNKTPDVITLTTPTPTATLTPTPTATFTPLPTFTPTPIPVPDTEAPLIQGAKDIVVKLKSAVTYTKGVTATDNSNEIFSFRGDNPNLWVETDNVNINKEGTYKAVYHAKDSSGNETTVTITVTVREYTEEEVYERADEILSKIIEDGMSAYQKAEVIFRYVRNNVGWKEQHGKDFTEDAAMGLLTEYCEGDCRVSCAVSEVLLTRAGIENMRIDKVVSSDDKNGPHCWNIINVGDGWYHFDTTIWHHDTNDEEAVNTGIFMWTTKRIKSSGSPTIRNQHVFDASLYPEIK